MISRRAVLIGGGATVLVAAGAGGVAVEKLGRRRVVDDLLDSCGSPGGHPPQARAVVRTGRLVTSHVRTPPGWAMIWPEGTTEGSAVPLCVVLTGRGDTHETMVDQRFGDWVTDMARTRGHRPFALAAFDGASDYWHRRADGDDRLTALLADFLPLCESRGLGADGTGRAMYGWSMGGYGALLAAETAPDQFRAVGVSSPALGTTLANSPQVAFDSEADFEAHDVFRRPDRLRGLAIRVDCGTGDPFHPFAKKFADALTAIHPALSPAPQSTFPPGCHDDGYWRRVRPAQFDAISIGLQR